MHMNTKKAAELKIPASVNVSSSSISLSIGIGYNNSTEGLSSGLDQNQDDSDSREDTSDTLHHSFTPPRSRLYEGWRDLFRPLRLNLSLGPLERKGTTRHQGRAA